MTGWRVGYLLAEARVIEEILKIHDPSVIAAPHASQIAALTALEGPQDCVSGFLAELDERRQIALAALDGLAPFFSYQAPTSAYYVFPRFTDPGVDATDFALRLLEEAGVVTIPGDAFGPAGRGHLRLCFCAETWEIRESFERLGCYLEECGLAER